MNTTFRVNDLLSTIFLDILYTFLIYKLIVSSLHQIVQVIFRYNNEASLCDIVKSSIKNIASFLLRSQSV